MLLERRYKRVTVGQLLAGTMLLASALLATTSAHAITVTDRASGATISDQPTITAGQTSHWRVNPNPDGGAWPTALSYTPWRADAQFVDNSDGSRDFVVTPSTEGTINITFTAAFPDRSETRDLTITVAADSNPPVGDPNPTPSTSQLPVITDRSNGATVDGAVSLQVGETARWRVDPVPSGGSWPASLSYSPWRADVSFDDNGDGSRDFVITPLAAGDEFAMTFTAAFPSGDQSRTVAVNVEGNSPPGDSGDNCSDAVITSQSGLKDIIADCDFPRNDFLIGFAMPAEYSNPGFDRITSGCVATNGEQDGYRWGACYNGEPGDVLAHRDVGKREFNFVTHETAQKMRVNQPAAPTHLDDPDNLTGDFDRRQIEDLFGSMNIDGGTMASHGHAFLFENVAPAWLDSGSSDYVERVLKDRVIKMLRYYRGRNLIVWDVVNEALSASITSADVAAFRANPEANLGRILKNNAFFRGKLGLRYLEFMFQTARDELDTWSPNESKPALIINDWKVVWHNLKSDALYELVRHLNRNEKLVDGVGLQAHLWSDFLQNRDGTGSAPNRITHTFPNADTPSLVRPYQTIGQNMLRFANIGADIYITEMDVRLRRYGGQSWGSLSAPFQEQTMTAAENQSQSSIYRYVLDACLDQPSCKAFQVWGITDRFAWQPGQSLLFSGRAQTLANGERTFGKKPAYDAVRDELTSRLQ